ncbi:MAG: uroporphyrinogen-III decarboxylase-like protein [Planctomycetota bacterium]|nr:uroporphyrinogen-III decarboxylase-like protein [Planctomycetota bacterium]
MAMTPRERWLALLNREKPDRIPTDYQATPEVTERLIRDLDCGNYEGLLRRLHIDGRQHIGARPTVTAHPDDPQADIWGIRHRRVDYGSGAYWEVEYHPLAAAQSVEDIEKFKWPNPDWYDWEDFRQQVRRVSRERPVMCGYYEPYLLYCAMRGMEQAMVDLIEAPEIADAILGRIFDYFYRLNGRMWEIGHGVIDLCYIAEDLGSQTSLLMSLDLIRRFILPNQKRMADLARSHGIHIMYHTDGAAREVLPDLIRVTGIEILNPVQWRCPGMEREGLVRDFGQDLIFHGAVDNQQTLAFGSPEDVRQEVRDNIRIFAPPARWICNPCHNIQPVSPTANIVAMYETIWEEGRL